MSNNIILIGFMGSGKTSVGKALAEKLAFSFLDTDLYIEQKEKMSISHIFDEKGEQYFRDLETSVLKELLEGTRDTVLAVGGGTPLRKENQELLQQLGCVIYLQITPQTVMEHLAGDTTRPLLQCEDPAKKIEELLTARQPLYQEAANRSVSVDGRAVEQIVEDICEKIQ